jgi:hypothetical protein
MREIILSQIIILFLLITGSCNYECDESSSCIKSECETNCDLTLNEGPCNLFITKYYYNRVTMKCDSFIWGGCQGVVPFETLKDCQTCGCN